MVSFSGGMHGSKFEPLENLPSKTPHLLPIRVPSVCQWLVVTRHIECVIL